MPKGKEFFTQADCDVEYFPRRSDHYRIWSISPEKANRLLEERSRLVLGWEDQDLWTFGDIRRHTHTARIICVEPNAPDTLESLLKEIIKVHGLGGGLVERANRLINIESIEEPDSTEKILKDWILWREHPLRYGLAGMNELVERAKKLVGKKCEHKNSRISEPHLAGARTCNDCGAYRPSASNDWVIEVGK